MRRRRRRFRPREHWRVIEGGKRFVKYRDMARSVGLEVGHVVECYLGGKAPQYLGQDGLWVRQPANATGFATRQAAEEVMQREANNNQEKGKVPHGKGNH